MKNKDLTTLEQEILKEWHDIGLGTILDNDKFKWYSDKNMYQVMTDFLKSVITRVEQRTREDNDDLVRKVDDLIGFLNKKIDKDMEMGIKREWEEYKLEKGDSNGSGGGNGE